MTTNLKKKPRGSIRNQPKVNGGEIALFPSYGHFIELIEKGVHNPKIDGHAMSFDKVVYRDKLGRKNGSGGGRAMLRFACVQDACPAERLLPESAVSDELDRIDQA